MQRFALYYSHAHDLKFSKARQSLSLFLTLTLLVTRMKTLILVTDIRECSTTSNLADAIPKIYMLPSFQYGCCDFQCVVYRLV